MSDVPVTGMTARAMFCMYPENLGGCDEHQYLVPIHYRVEDPEGEGTLSNTIIGWLCKPHALDLALQKRTAANPPDRVEE